MLFNVFMLWLFFLAYQENTKVTWWMKSTKQMDNEIGHYGTTILEKKHCKGVPTPNMEPFGW